MKFSYKLQELRKGSGMSQEEFAELLGVSRQSVSKWESGKGYPEIDKLIFISNYFNTSLDLLLKDSPDYNSNPSMNSNKSNKSRKSKKTISLTKDQNDINNNPPKYMSDPIPNQKKVSYPLKRVSVSANAQVRPVKKYKFGNKNKKVSHFMVGIALFMAIGISSGIVIALQDNDYSYEITEVTEEEYYDEPQEFNDLYSYGMDASWENLYNDDTTSTFETSMLDSINTQEQSLLIDTNGNVYFTGYDIVSIYLEAQYQMKNELNCMELYQKYISFIYNYNDSTNFIELYSYDYDEWVIINEVMLNIYPEQYIDNVPYDVPSKDGFNELDILSSSYENYKDWNSAPFEYVFRINKQTKATVSSDILDLCIDAMSSRKNYLTMTEYISTYEAYNNKYELVNCKNSKDITFVPKEFIMISASDLENNQVEDNVAENIMVNDDDNEE